MVLGNGTFSYLLQDLPPEFTIQVLPLNVIGKIAYLVGGRRQVSNAATLRVIA